MRVLPTHTSWLHMIARLADCCVCGVFLFRLMVPPSHHKTDPLARAFAITSSRKSENLQPRREWARTDTVLDRGAGISCQSSSVKEDCDSCLLLLCFGLAA